MVRRRGAAFTLVELLVVIGVMALWAVMLAPVLARTRPNTKAAQCLNMLRQWGVGQSMAASENTDMLATDGMGGNKSYAPGSPMPSGTPDDPYAWFNVVPPYWAAPGLSNYYHLPGGDPRTKMPFPGRPNAPSFWHCPSAAMSVSDYAALAGGGLYGFFSYAENTDLKQTGVYPTWMPTLGVIPKPAATVLMYDAAFNPVTEAVNGSPEYNSVNPANRYRSFGTRHGNGGIISFVDGHARMYSLRSVTNTAWGTTYNGEPLNPEIIWNWTQR